MRLREPSTTDAYLIGNEASLFSISELGLHVWPIPATIGLGLLIVVPSGYVFALLSEQVGTTDSAWLLTANHVVMLLIAVALMACFNRGLNRGLGRGNFSEYGLEWPKQKNYVRSALLWGAAFGVIMLVADYFPEILRHAPPPDQIPMTPRNIGSWLFFEWIFVGPTEEIPFRGLLQTFLMQRTSGRVRFWRYEMHVAGIILALLFALSHLTSFWTQKFWMALAQQIYAFALGVLYAYWREKSGSVLAPIIGHNVSDGVEQVLKFLMTWAWR
ncbi:MAG TPA: CPBP family intramembrane glutamic endopeptidase [Blastocatellia bacterium]